MKKQALIALTSLGLAASAVADTANFNPSADATVNYRSGNASSDTNFGTQLDLDLYYSNQVAPGIWAMSYVRFDLSSLAGATITDATLTFTKLASNIANITNATRNDALTTGRFAVYGLLDVAGNTAQGWSETAITGNSVRGTLDHEIIADSGTKLDTTTRTVSFDGVGETVTTTLGSITGTSGSSLVSFLQGRVDAGSSIGWTTFIVDNPDLTSGRGFAFGSRENAGFEPVLSITYTPVPEPSTFALLAGIAGMGCVGLRRRRRA